MSNSLTLVLFGRQSATLPNSFHPIRANLYAKYGNQSKTQAITFFAICQLKQKYSTLKFLLAQDHSKYYVLLLQFSSDLSQTS